MSLSGEKAEGSKQKAGLFLPSADCLLLTDVGLGIAALALYALTLSPGLLPADSGEYQTMGALLGVSHPPGYALYTLLSWVISRGPISPATAINFLSALFAALTLMCVSRAVRQWTGSLWAGLFAAGALGFSVTFWAQATTANVRMLTALAVAWALERLAAYQQDPKNNRTLAQVALALGLGVSHHGSVVFMAAVLGLFALALRPSALRRPWALLTGLLPFLAWLYFPLRAGAPYASESLRTLNGFLEHVLARGFGGDMLAFATPEAFPARLFVLSQILPFQWNGALLLLAALGAGLALWSHRPAGLMLLGAWLVHTFIAITYRAPQTVEYLLPSYVVMAVWMGFAATEAMRLAARAARVRPALHLAAVLLPASMLLFQFAATYPSYRALAQDDATRDYAEAVLDNAPPGAVVFTAWHWAGPLRYLQIVEGRRPDLELVYVFPRGEPYAQTWVSLIDAALAEGRAVVVTSFFAPEYGARPYRFAPRGPAWEVRREPLLTPPDELAGAQSYGDLDFLGFDYQPSIPNPYASITLTAAWRLAAPRDVSFFVHLIGPDGASYAQDDVVYSAARYSPGEVLLDRYELALRPDALPGTYTLLAGAYRPDGVRLAEVPLTTVALDARRDPPVTAHPLLWPANGAMLIGYDVDNTLPDSPRLYLHWQLGHSAVTTNVLGAPLALPPGPGYATTAHEFTPGQALSAAGLTLGTDRAWRYVPFGNALILTRAMLGARIAHPGEAYTVALGVLAARPSMQELSVKADIVGPGWHAQVDTIPVYGALPTLKWIAGSRLTDRLTLTIPADAPPGDAQVRLGWYDYFTQRDLPVLDPRLAQPDSTINLGTVTIVK
jgi:hypothetical protein